MKCGKPNPATELICLACGRHLYVACHHCGELNYRANERCVECRTQLRPLRRRAPEPRVYQFVWPVRWSIQAPRWWVIPAQIVAFVASVLVTVAAVKILVEWPGWRPKPPSEPEVLVLENGRLRPLGSSDLKP